VRQPLFLPSYRSFPPSPSRTTAQPHRTHPRTSTNKQPTRPRPSLRYLRNSRWRGAILLPYTNDFLFFANSRDAALHLRDRVASLLDRARTQPQERPLGTHKSASTSASRSALQPLPYEPLLRNYTPLQPSPGPYCNAQLETPGGYPPDNSRSSPEKRNTSTSPSRRLVSTSANSTTSSLLEHGGGTGKTHLSAETRPPEVDASPLSQQRLLHLLPNRDRIHALR
jgi:hypothetical protein